MISVLYGFLWTLIDLEVKRLEPSFQLSKPERAAAEDSVLLHCPFDFLATVPFKALKRNYWAVFTVSLVMVLVFWGLTPLQAGIFAVRAVTITNDLSTYQATSYSPIERQGNLSALYAQSVYNTAWLNESLPPFMARDFVLDPFGLDESGVDGVNVTITGETTVYSIDVMCKTASSANGGTRFNSTSGCSFEAPPYRPIPNNDTNKPCDAILLFGFSESYSLHPMVQEQQGGHAVRNRRRTHGTWASKCTSPFCIPTYYQQRVNATISLPSKAVVSTIAMGPKLPSQDDMFNTSTFEWAISSGLEEFPARGDYPTTGFPDQKTHLQHMPLDLAYLPKMAPFAITAYQKPPDAYLDPETLRLS